MVAETIALYRAYCRTLIGVLWVHQREISTAASPNAVVERLIHATARNPNPKYAYFDRRFPKFPSYLRRAAIMAALGQVSSFSTRYDQWQGGTRKRRDALPPRRTSENALNPPLYRGQCVRFDASYQHVEIKVWSGTDWIWTTLRVAAKRHRHEAPQNKALSPMLLADGGGVRLAIPFEVPVQFPSRKSAQRVCGVDLGIRKTATASIVSADGTVVARQFFHRGADIDRRDKGLATVRSKARLTIGKSGTLSKGFCRAVYRKARHRNLDMAQRLSGEIVAFARTHEAQVIVLRSIVRPATAIWTWRNACPGKSWRSLGPMRRRSSCWSTSSSTGPAPDARDPPFGSASTAGCIVCSPGGCGSGQNNLACWSSSYPRRARRNMRMTALAPSSAMPAIGPG